MRSHIIIALAVAAGAVLAASMVTAVMAAQGQSTAATVGENRKFVDYKDVVE